LPAYGISEIVKYVENMMTEIVQMIPQFKNQKINIQKERTNTRKGRPDVWVVSAGEKPFFVIQVKTPGAFLNEESAALKHTHGQIYDYLLSLHEDDGLSVPYGMLCTYEQTQICWLENAHEKRSLQDRVLNVSKVYHIGEHQEKIIAIASAVLKGYTSIIKHHHSREGFGYANVFKREGMEWQELKCKMLRLHQELPCQVTIDTTGLFLLNCFPRGIEGKVYHVCDASGKQCVIKLYSRGVLNRVDALKDEIRFWKEINQITISSVELANQKGLLIPYLVPLREEEIKEFQNPESTIYQQVRTLIESCVNKGWYQDDASWRHIGWYQDDSPIEERKLQELNDIETQIDELKTHKVQGDELQLRKQELTERRRKLLDCDHVYDSQRVNRKLKLLDFGHVLKVEEGEKEEKIQDILHRLRDEIEIFVPSHESKTDGQLCPEAQNSPPSELESQNSPPSPQPKPQIRRLSSNDFPVAKKHQYSYDMAIEKAYAEADDHDVFCSNLSIKV